MEHIRAKFFESKNISHHIFRKQQCLLRILQALVIFLLLFFGIITYILQLKIPQEAFTTKSAFQTEEIKSQNLHESSFSDTIIDVNNFQVLLSPKTAICRKENILFFIVVHSKPNHFEQRRIIRSSWGKLKELKSLSGPSNNTWHIKLIFVLGEASHRSYIFRKNVEKLAQTEAAKYADIIQGSFRDKYHNLVYKHLFSIKWAYQYCQNAKFIIKADDDAFIDLYGLHYYLERTLGPLATTELSGVLAGNVSPAFSAPQRRGKWAVSLKEYPLDSYPSYLGGLAYVMTPDVARDLSRAVNTMQKKPLWVDDVFITGIVASSLKLNPLHMNARYIYDHQEVSRWFQTSSQNSPPPFTFAHLNTSQDNWKELMQNLWTRVSTINNQNQLS